MTEAMRRCRGWLVLACLSAPGAVPAQELERGYLEAAYARDFGGGPADGGPTAVGVTGAARLPISRNWFVAGWAQRLEPYVDTFGGQHEEENRFALGLGARRDVGAQEFYARATYVKYENWREPGNPPRVEGGLLSFGARSMISERVALDLEGGMGYAAGGGIHELLLTGRGSLAYEFAPHLWLYAEGSLELFDYSMARAGLRFSFAGSKAAPRPPGVKAAGGDAPVALAVGVSVVAQRPLQLQQQPAFGARETLLVPAGETLELLETRSNSFGNWWRVSFAGQTGWIREGHLK